MSIRVRGTITIQRKNSARGAFNIGDLNTEIGEFEVKDSLIEEFEPGKYTGDFLIKWIAPDSFSWRGRVFVKNRATLEEILIDEADETAPAPSSPPEPDPIESQSHQPAHAQASTSASNSTSAASVAPSPESAAPAPRQPRSSPREGNANPVASAPAAAKPASDIAADEHLFGNEIFALLQRKELIKLDPSVDREMFRKQRDRLRTLGYAFDPKSQSWSTSNQPAKEAVPA
jgi:hypothetical protein